MTTNHRAAAPLPFLPHATDRSPPDSTSRWPLPCFYALLSPCFHCAGGSPPASTSVRHLRSRRATALPCPPQRAMLHMCCQTTSSSFSTSSPARSSLVSFPLTLGELMRVLAQTTGLEPERQRLFFREKEKRDDEFLHASGANDGAKLLLLEKHVPANVEQKGETVMMDESMMRACEAVVRVRFEVDKLSAKVCELEKRVLAGRKVEEK